MPETRNKTKTALLRPLLKKGKLWPIPICRAPLKKEKHVRAPLSLGSTGRGCRSLRPTYRGRAVVKAVERSGFETDHSDPGIPLP